ncbi:MAG: hypothetical protein FWF60_00075 [Oscillospiraceae bacterium]|nr:hypothetical protein [Oscillospiraceae bacterium]
MSEYDPTPAQTKPHPYQKLDGWLLYFVVSDFLALPLRVANLLMKIKIANDRADMMREWLIEENVIAPESVMGYQPTLLDFLPLVSCVISIFIAILIIRRSPRFLLAYQLSILANLGMIAVGTFSDGMFRSLADEIGMLFAILLVSVLLLVIIGSYFLMMLYYVRSVRVRTYMGSDEYLRLAFFTKKIKGPEPAVPDAAAE